MNRVLVRFHPSTIPEDEKQRRLWDVLGILLRTSKKKCINEETEGNEKKQRGKGLDKVYNNNPLPPPSPSLIEE